MTQPKLRSTGPGVVHYFRKKWDSQFTACFRFCNSSTLTSRRLCDVTCKMCLMMVQLKRQSLGPSISGAREPFDSRKHRSVSISLDHAAWSHVDAVVVIVPQRGRNPRKQGVRISIEEAEEWCRLLRRGIRSAKRLSAANRADGANGRTIDKEFSCA